MIQPRERITGITAAALTVLTVVWRTALLPQIGSQLGRYAAAYGCLAVWLIVWLWQRRRSRSVTARPIEGRAARPVGGAAAAAGVAILLQQLYDLMRFWMTRRLPAPSAQEISALDRLLFWLTLLCGIAGGLAMLWLGICWLRGAAQDPLTGRAWLFVPMLWLWMRLARYTVSYTFAVRFSESIFEFALLALPLLFLFLLGRRSVDGDSVKAPTLVAVTLLAAVAGGSGVLSRCGMLLLYPQQAVNVVSIASLPDLLLALFAVVVLRYWYTLPVREEEPEAEEAQLPGPALMDPSSDSNA